MERIIFYILAVIMIAFAIASVSSRKMLRSVIYLLFVLIGIAGLYFLFDYNFLAAIQLTVYAGGIIVLMIFSVLLVHHIEMELETARPLRRLISALLCLAGLGIFITSIYSYDFNVSLNATTTTTAQIGEKLLSYGAGGFILPFEVISVLLLSAMIGAIVVARGSHKEEKKITPNKTKPQKEIKEIESMKVEILEEEIPL
ncbi:NADH-quinone oxidoreductase subunit J [Gramella jeungdoensis]|uniref:NADH-quinone oxidoreductase subunit J n=1 Tax=Gramella jeungdoensis TaxID=708091 RepID=A0ABT0YY37_9FLAO|nr:NADH-quinone oxidoreductase subunit J [Gramella jeungdoensis]MCM8568388.1 NADH-quinone oxidoreductase subunit J [Gramella jeungdoensis]